MALRLCLALIASTLLFLNPVACSDRLPEAEGGNFVRIEAQTPEALATEEKDRALTLLRKWGLGSQRRFAEVAELGTTPEMVMMRSWEYPAVVVVVLGDKTPQRRNLTAGQLFLSVEPFVGIADWDDAPDAVQGNLPIAALNRGADFLEAILSRPLYPFRLATRRFGRSGWMDMGPSAVYDVSEGIIYLDRRVSTSLSRLPERARTALESFTERLLQPLGMEIASAMLGGESRNASYDGAGQAGGFGGIGGVASLVARLAATALAATIAAQVPVWFCMACPLVLGLLAPFVWNLGLTAAAEAVCQHYRLPDDQCNELWYGAFAVAMVLSLASAIPIVFVCRLPECARGLSRQLAPFA